MARCPHLVFYRVNPITAGIVARKLLLPYVGLPNVSCRDASSSPEFLQDEATVANLARAALNLYDDTVTRRRLEALFAGMADALDGGHVRPSPPTRWRRELRAGGGSVLIAGVDEAGRGPLRRAGSRGRGDSRCRSGESRACATQAAHAARRAKSWRWRSVRAPIAWAVAESDVGEIDTINIFQATLLAMRRAIEQPDARRPRSSGSTALHCPHSDYPIAGDRRRRSPGGRHRRGVDSRQDDARRAAGRARPQLPAVRLCPAQGLLDARASRRAGDARPVRGASAHLRPVMQIRFVF